MLIQGMAETAIDAEGVRDESRTAELNAAMRAAESRRPRNKRLFDDPFAHAFLRRGVFKGWASSNWQARLGLSGVDRLFPGIQAEILLRGNYADEAIAQAKADAFGQIVLLGAGYDSTALRHDLGDVALFEVDAPATQREKRRRMDEAGLAPEGMVTFVPCDFEVDSVAERLGRFGFSNAERSLVIWLGVSYYLSAERFDMALDEIADFSALGSRLVLDYMDQGVIDGTTAFRGARRAADWVAKRGEPYVLGFSPESIAAVVEERGYLIRDRVRVSDLARRYRPPDGVWCRTDDYMGIVAAERGRLPGSTRKRAES
jgi:methyltransferase (TIGR00027 family)